MEKKLNNDGKVPQSVAEAMVAMDRLLEDFTEEELAVVLDDANFHFGLGLWIRNNWIFQPKEGNADALMREIERISPSSRILFPEPEDDESGPHVPMIFPDEVSGFLLRAYKKYKGMNNE